MKTLISDLKTGNFKHVYLLTGEETYLKLQYRDRLVKALMPDENSMNLTVYADGQPDEAEIISMAETLPFFSDRRVIRLDGSGLFKRTADLLPDYLKSIPDYLYMIFTEDEADKRGRMYKAVRKYGAVIEFGEQPESVLSAWVLRILKENGLNIRKSSMEYLLSRTGPDMTHIRLETDKLVHYCAADPERTHNEVTREDIDACITERTENRIFEMVSAVTERRIRDALSLYADLLALKEPPMRILFLIAQEYGRLLIIKEMDLAGTSVNEIATAARMPPFAVRKSLRLARACDGGFLKERLADCAEAEEAVKTGRMNDRLAVELILTVQKRIR